MILICVTVSVVSGGLGAPAVSVVFAAAAKTATVTAVTGGAVTGIISGVVTGAQTGDADLAIKTALLGGSKAFKWGAITGAVKGAASETVSLYRATLGPGSKLTMNDVALIQRKTRLPLEFIRNMHSMDEFKLY